MERYIPECIHLTSHMSTTVVWGLNQKIPTLVDPPFDFSPFSPSRTLVRDVWIKKNSNNILSIMQLAFSSSWILKWISIDFYHRRINISRLMTELMDECSSLYSWETFEVVKSITFSMILTGCVSPSWSCCYWQ